MFSAQIRCRQRHKCRLACFEEDGAILVHALRVYDIDRLQGSHAGHAVQQRNVSLTVVLDQLGPLAWRVS